MAGHYRSNALSEERIEQAIRDESKGKRNYSYGFGVTFSSLPPAPSVSTYTAPS